MALKWVRDNIKSFGGDSNKVTIFGQSVGAASVQYHMLSQHSTGKSKNITETLLSLLLFQNKWKCLGLFHRAIMQSGSSFCLWAAPEDQGQSTRSLATKINCPKSPSHDLINCLRSRSPDEIMSNVINQSVGR